MADLSVYFPQATAPPAVAAGPPTPLRGMVGVSGGVSQQLSGNLSVTSEPLWLVAALIGLTVLAHWLGE